MKRFAALTAVLVGAGALFVACEQEPTNSRPEGLTPSLSQDVVEGRYIVVLRPGTDPAELAANYAVATRFEYRHALTGFSAQLPDAARSALERNPAVRWIEPVKMRYLDVKGKGGPDKPPKPCKGNKCPPPPPPQPIDACVPGTGDNLSNDPLDELYGIVDVNAPASNTWINSPVSVDIAILDSGADTDHTDLCVHNAVGFTNEGWEDNNGHGSHTSGTAGARDDNFADGGEVVGVAPTARIWSVKVCTAGGLCPGDAIVAGIDYVTEHADEIDVANMSLGGGGSDQPHPIDPLDCSPITGDAEHLAICNSVAAGVTYVVSAGNSSADAANFTPAAFDEVITVAASDINENPAGFSNYGADVDLIAPGVDIKSTYLNNGYANASGTSMSSPHVAGGAALYIIGNPSATPLQVRNALVAAGRAWAGQGGQHPEPMLDVSGF